MRARGIDRHGSGAYLASRGSRKHNGIDICCEQGELIKSFSGGIVTKIGYPYSQGPDADPAKKKLRYIQVTDDYGLDVRYFYIMPILVKGDQVHPGDILGEAQGLADIYEGITEHYHFEVLKMIGKNKLFIDPIKYLKALPSGSGMIIEKEI